MIINIWILITLFVFNKSAKSRSENKSSSNTIINYEAKDRVKVIYD
jgi:hypothetical protein